MQGKLGARNIRCALGVQATFIRDALPVDLAVGGVADAGYQEPDVGLVVDCGRHLAK